MHSDSDVSLLRRVRFNLVSSIRIHGGYVAGSARHDIALAQLRHYVPFDRHVSPVCLHGVLNNDTIPPSARLRCYATGWGVTLSEGDCCYLQ